MKDPAQTCDTSAGAVIDARAASDRATGTLEAGTVVGDWRIERTIGRGGMGTVYAAVHDVIGKRAAIKVGRADLPLRTRDDAILEAWVVNQIGHPNIIDIFHIGRLADQRPYLVMELLSGCTLGERLDHGRMPAAEACDVLLQICAALEAAHANGVVHRDLKPANIFLAQRADGSLSVKVVDWGIAQLIDAGDGGPAARAETLIGTPEYMSPEQARGELVDGQSDIYSLGAIAYELFLEGSPYAADSVPELLNAHVAVAPTPPSELWPDIPPVLDDLLRRMLRKAPGERPDAGQVADALREVRDALERRRGVIIRPPTSRIARMPADPLGATLNTPSSELPLMASPVSRALRRMRAVRWGAVAVGATLLTLLMLVVGARPSASMSVPAAVAGGAGGTPIVADVDVCATTPVDAPAEAEVIHASAAPAAKPVARTKRSSERRRSAPRIDPDGTIDPFE